MPSGSFGPPLGLSLTMAVDEHLAVVRGEKVAELAQGSPLRDIAATAYTTAACLPRFQPPPHKIMRRTLAGPGPYFFQPYFPR